MMIQQYDLKNMTEDELIALRDEANKKSAIYHTKQMGLKIALNSCYGALGNEYFRFFDVRMAEAVTLSGQLSIRWIAHHLNEYMNKLCKTENIPYVIYMDTDSCYIRFDEFIKVLGMQNKPKNEIVEFLSKAANHINEFIDVKYQELADYMNAFDQKMEMGREVIADRGFWTAKKRYALHVYDSEGTRYTEPHLKIMGMETAKSSTPAPCRTKLKEAIRLILTTDETTVLKFADDFKNEFVTLKASEVAFPRGVNNLGKYKNSTTIYSKGTPIHVKGSLLYNNFVQQNKLTNKYELIKDGDKIKFLYLKEPNPIKESVIAFPGYLPPEMKLEDYVDYNKQFDKSFMQPLRDILNVIGWRSSNEENSLASLFE